MNKLYTRIDWVNNTTPAINQTNLNLMSKGIDDIDNRVIQIADDVLVTVPQLQGWIEQAQDIVEELQEMTTRPPYIGDNGNWYTWNIEQGQYVDSGVDASITVTMADVTLIAPDASPYVTNTGTNTDPIFHLYLPRSKTTYEWAVDGGYSGTEQEFYDDLTQFSTYADNAAASAAAALASQNAASSSARDAATSATNAANIESEIETMIDAVVFSVNFTSGELEYTNNETYNFSINQTTGNLEWEVIV